MAGGPERAANQAKREFAMKQYAQTNAKSGKAISVLPFALRLTMDSLRKLCEICLQLRTRRKMVGSTMQFDHL